MKYKKVVKRAKFDAAINHPTIIQYKTKLLKKKINWITVLVFREIIISKITTSHRWGAIDIFSSNNLVASQRHHNYKLITQRGIRIWRF